MIYTNNLMNKAVFENLKLLETQGRNGNKNHMARTKQLSLYQSRSA